MLYSYGYTHHSFLLILVEIVSPKGILLHYPMQKPLFTHINIYINIIYMNSLNAITCRETTL